MTNVLLEPIVHLSALRVQQLALLVLQEKLHLSQDLLMLQPAFHVLLARTAQVQDSAISVQLAHTILSQAHQIYQLVYYVLTVPIIHVKVRAAHLPVIHVLLEHTVR